MIIIEKKYTGTHGFFSLKNPILYDNHCKCAHTHTTTIHTHEHLLQNETAPTKTASNDKKEIIIIKQILAATTWITFIF